MQIGLTGLRETIELTGSTGRTGPTGSFSENFVGDTDFTGN